MKAPLGITYWLKSKRNRTHSLQKWDSGVHLDRDGAPTSEGGMRKNWLGGSRGQAASVSTQTASARSSIKHSYRVKEPISA